MRVRLASLIVIVIAASVVASHLLHAQDASGKAAYDRNCASCHGSDATGSLGPSLIPLRPNDADLLALVRSGGSQMIAISARDMPDDDVRAAARYLRGLGGAAAAPASQAARPAAAPRPELTRGTPMPAISPVSDDMLANPPAGDWLNWRRTLDGWGHSPLNAITPANVRSLQLVWSWAMEPGPSQTTPLVHDGVMFLANPGNIVDALDARTGALHWEYRRPMDERRRASAQTRNLAIYQDVVVLATVDAHLVALDVRTGAVRWDANVGGDGRAGFTFTSGPIVADGVIVGGLTGCSRFDEETCYIVGVDGRSGTLLWKTSTVAAPGAPGGDTWGGLPLTFRAGGDAWIPGSYDPVAKVIYWGTAQAKPWAQGVRGTDGDALYTNSTLALDPKTGAMKWYFQHMPGDSYDMDETFERVLVDYDGRKSVFTMGKLGLLWELDRQSGRFVKATDLGYQTLVDVNQRTGKVTYKPGMLQAVGKEITFCPSTGGLKSLRAMAYAPSLRAMIVPLFLNCETATFEAMELREGNGGTGPVRVAKYSFHPKSPDTLGELQAMDIATGRTIWRQRRRAPYNTAALTTAGGLVFVGDWDRTALAYDLATGTPLWETRLPTMTNGYPITYSAGGRQFVAIGAGNSITGSSWASRIPPMLLPETKVPGGGNGLFVFALP